MCYIDPPRCLLSNTPKVSKGNKIREITTIRIRDIQITKILSKSSSIHIHKRRKRPKKCGKLILFFFLYSLFASPDFAHLVERNTCENSARSFPTYTASEESLAWRWRRPGKTCFGGSLHLAFFLYIPTEEEVVLYFTHFPHQLHHGERWEKEGW